MILLQGKGMSRGLTRGKLYFFRHTYSEVEQYTVEDVEVEKVRFHNAAKEAAFQLEELADMCRKEAEGMEKVLLLKAHAMLVRDEEYKAEVLSVLDQENCNAEYAVQTAANRLFAAFSAFDDSYMQARAADLKDVTRRILNNLMGICEGQIASEEPVILAAGDFSPSETIRLDKNKILGFVTREGSPDSHTAILARTMGIPAVCGLGERLKEIYHGQLAYMDGESGQVILDPDVSTYESLRAKYEKQQKLKLLLEELKGKEDVTLDGRHIDVYCNIDTPDELAAVYANDGQGIGLFRSEFLYLAANTYPTEEEQFEAYKAVVSGMHGKKVIIRTLDIGADKQADYFGLKKEVNPALGLRAIRICLEQPEVFRTQLRALYRASAYGRIAILFPMITSVWEVQECRKACRAVMEELTSEGIPFRADTELGIMIETPASVFIADELAAEVDFFSVGTNDLTQYLLVCDRQSSGMDRFSDSHHPAVLRALKMTAQAAHSRGIRVGICGELAADPNMLPAFLEMGIDELSVAPSEVLPLRAEIRKSLAGYK